MSSNRKSLHDNNETAKYRHNAPDQFGKSPEIDLALEKKLLANLKKHSPKILQPINTGSTTLARSGSNKHVDESSLPSPRHLSSSNHPSSSNYPSSNHNNHTSYNNTSNFSTTSADSNLLSALTQRLTKLEEQSKVHIRELASKEHQLQQLHNRVEEYRQQSDQLKHERDQSKRQIVEMEAFLNDYGLVWVGGHGEQISNNNNLKNNGNNTNNNNYHTNNNNNNILDDLNDHQVKLPHLKGAENNKTQNTRDKPERIEKQSHHSKDNNGDRSFHVDVEKIKCSIEELNILAMEGSTVFDHSGKGKRIRGIKEPQMVPITLYRNGFLMFSGPFRSYTAPESMAFINDLCDGYFPYELKDRYPHGVLFKLTDMSSKEYSTRSNEIVNKSLDSNIRGMGSLSDSPPQNTNQFLQKLPLSTIKNGRIVDVRQSITNLTKGVTSNSPRSQNSPRSTNSQAYNTSNKVVVANTGASTGRDVTHLKLKMDSGDTVIVKLNYDATIHSLRETIDKYKNHSGAYEIRTTFPNQLHNDLSVTLRSAGLIPNALLYIRDVKM